MNPALSLSVNMCMVPGVKNSSCIANDEGLAITVEGGHPEAVAKMIAQTIPPDVPLVGPVEVEVVGRTVRFIHENPDVEQSPDMVKALPLVEDGDVFEPAGTPPPNEEGSRSSSGRARWRTSPRWLVQFLLVLALVAWAVLDREWVIGEHGLLRWIVSVTILVGCAGALGYLAFRRRSPDLFEAPEVHGEEDT